jgi:hypothetical protein
MDRIERIEHPQESLMRALTGWQTELWTALPGIVQSFDPVEMTVSVQPSIQAQIENKETGETSWVNLPILVDVPVVIQSAGGMSITIPIKKDDECLVVFSSRCIDSWWQQGGVQSQNEFRLHDLSDGFAFIGPKSVPNAISNYSTTSLQIRNSSGAVKIDINPTSEKVIITTSELTINGNVKINGNVETVGTLKNNSHDVGSTHMHSDVTTGSSNTGLPL